MPTSATPERACDAPMSEFPAQRGTPGWLLPGALVLRLMLVTALALALSGALATWLVTQALEREAVRQLVGQQTDEVEVVARLLASKIEQSQKLLRTVAEGITPGMLKSPSALEWLLQQGLPAAQFFDTMQVAHASGQVRLSLRAGHLEQAADLDPAERDALRRTLVGGKPLVCELIAGGRPNEARVMFTMPLHHTNGSVLGVVAGALRLQSQSLLPPSMAWPTRDNSEFIVFTRDGTILSHSDPRRILGQVRDEAGLAPVYARWLAQAQPVVGRGITDVQPDYIASMAGMPLPQWIVARVSRTQALLAPLRDAQHQAWWLAIAGMALCLLLALAAMGWMAQPLAQLTHRSRHWLQTGTGLQPLADMDWPRVDMAWSRAGDEVGELLRAFQGLAQQGRRQQMRKDLLDAQLQAVLDKSSAGIVISRHGLLDKVSRQACLMLGYAAHDELQGRPVSSLYASDADYAQVADLVRTEMVAHGAFDGDICLRRKNGSPLWVRVQGQGVRPDELRGGMVWILENISAARQAQVQQSRDRRHDALTQLPNRAAFDERLGLLLAQRAAEGAVQGAKGNPPPDDGVVLFLDLDHFTEVNDIAGHDAGDDVLRHVARLLGTQVRQIGWVARLGGDEFAVVLPGCALARGQAVAEQLRAAVQAWEHSYQGRRFTLGVSIGLVALDASLQDVASVLYAADMACHEAKRAGRNRVQTRAVTASGRMALRPA